jgi:hypothetical protein
MDARGRACVPSVFPRACAKLYLDLADFLLIAEDVLGLPAEAIAGWRGVGVAESALNARDARARPAAGLRRASRQRFTEAIPASL